MITLALVTIGLTSLLCTAVQVTINHDQEERRLKEELVKHIYKNKRI